MKVLANSIHSTLDRTNLHYVFIDLLDCEIISLLSFFVDVGAFVKEHECHEGFDDEFQTYILDEDKLCDLLEPICEKGGVIIDFHSCDVFPERWFELVCRMISFTILHGI